MYVTLLGHMKWWFLEFGTAFYGIRMRILLMFYFNWEIKYI